MLILRDTRCSKDDCGGQIGVISYYDKELKKEMVSHGCCIKCLCDLVLPYESMIEFRKHCIIIPEIF